MVTAVCLCEVVFYWTVHVCLSYWHHFLMACCLNSMVLCTKPFGCKFLHWLWGDAMITIYRYRICLMVRILCPVVLDLVSRILQVDGEIKYP